MNSIQRRAHKTGFTLIELIVVIAILAVLTLIIVPNVTKYTTSANTTVCETNRKTILREMSYGILSGKYADESSAFTAVVESHGGKAAAGTSTITATGICPNGGTYTYSYDSSTNTVTIECDKHGLSSSSIGTNTSNNAGNGSSTDSTNIVGEIYNNSAYANSWDAFLAQRDQYGSSISKGTVVSYNGSLYVAANDNFVKPSVVDPSECSFMVQIDPKATVLDSSVYFTSHNTGTYWTVTTYTGSICNDGTTTYAWVGTTLARNYDGPGSGDWIALRNDKQY